MKKLTVSTKLYAYIYMKGKYYLHIAIAINYILIIIIILFTVQEHATTYTIISGVRLKSQIFVDNLNYRYKSRSRNNRM